MVGLLVIFPRAAADILGRWHQCWVFIFLIFSCRHFGMSLGPPYHVILEQRTRVSWKNALQRQADSY